MAIKKGICKNFGECDLADERKIQEVDSADFICEECGKPLFECESGKKKTTTPNPKKKFLIAGIAGLAVIGGGIAAILGFSGKDSSNDTIKGVSLSKSQDSLIVGNNDTLKALVSPIGVASTLKWASSDTTVLKVENGIVTAVGEGNAKIGVQVQENKELKAFCSYTVTNATIVVGDPKEGEDEDKNTSSSDSSKGGKKNPLPSQNGNVNNMNVTNGKYTGPIKNGKPHGLGTLVFTRTAVINSSDSKQRTAQAGESVQGQFVNGTFTIGKHYDANGNLIQSLNFGVAN